VKWFCRFLAFFPWLLVAAFLVWIDYTNRYHNTPHYFKPTITTFLVRYFYPDYRRKAKRPASRVDQPKSSRRKKIRQPSTHLPDAVPMSVRSSQFPSNCCPQFAKDDLDFLPKRRTE